MCGAFLVRRDSEYGDQMLFGVLQPYPATSDSVGRGNTGAIRLERQFGDVRFSTSQVDGRGDGSVETRTRRVRYKVGGSSPSGGIFEVAAPVQNALFQSSQEVQLGGRGARIQ